MIALTIGELAAVVGGRIVGDPGITVGGSVQTDSRLVEPGSIFMAMPGEQTDGHRFAGSAVEAGASLVIAERELDVAAPQIVVDSGLAALGALATHVIDRVRAVGDLTVVGITGSNGKTTTKSMLAAILEPHAPTVTPVKSFNNEVGAPMTMLRIDADTRWLVLEMGASHVGDIASLVAMSKPDIGVVLKVGLAHAGEFGGVEATQRAKLEMVSDLAADGVAVLNADDDRVAWMADRTEARVAWFGTDERSAAGGFWADDVESTLEGTTFTLRRGDERWSARMRILGEHHVMNALAAITVAAELGIEIDDALASLATLQRAERWRMELLEPGDGVTVINDSYNASPDSMAAALKSLAHMTRSAGRRSIAVLGEMAELGDESIEQHDRIGRLAVRLNIARIYVVGAAAKPIHNAAGLEGSYDHESVFVDTADEAEALLRADLVAGDVVLFKSSLSAGLKDLGDRIGGASCTS